MCVITMLKPQHSNSSYPVPKLGVVFVFVCLFLTTDKAHTRLILKHLTVTLHHNVNPPLALILDPLGVFHYNDCLLGLVLLNTQFP